jgi:Domain of unknown function (DUF6249)
MPSDVLILKQLLPLLIPIVAILGGVLVVIVVIAIDYKRKAQWLELHHKERLLAIERGVNGPELPAEFFGIGQGRGGRLPDQDLRTRSMRQGLLFLFVGIALSAALAINRDLDSAAWGLIPMAIGAANLVFARLADKG